MFNTKKKQFFLTQQIPNFELYSIYNILYSLIYMTMITLHLLLLWRVYWLHWNFLSDKEIYLQPSSHFMIYSIKSYYIKKYSNRNQDNPR